MCLSGKPPSLFLYNSSLAALKVGLLISQCLWKHLEDESAGCGTAPFTSQYMSWLLLQVDLLTV